MMKLPQAIGHEAKIAVKFFDATDIEAAYEAGAVELTAEQREALAADSELTVADILTEEQIARAGVAPTDQREAAYNLMVNGGITAMLNLLCGIAATNYSATNARICIGDGNGSVPTPTAADATLTANTNRYNKQVSSVSVSGQTATWVATFGPTVANFTWNEWGIDSGGGDGSGAASGLLNHKGVYLGAKVSGTTATVTVTITES